MQKSDLIFELSPWYIVICLLIGAGYAFFLYRKKGPWSKNINLLLAALRFIFSSLIAILILEPLIEQVRNSFAPPVYVFAVDNSISVSQSVEDQDNLLQRLSEIGNVLEGNGHEIAFRNFEDKSIVELSEEMAFNYPTSNISQLLQNIRSDYEGKNLAGVVLLSDGIYNQGISPEFNTFGFPVHTIGVGDTIPKNDINLRRLFYNKIAYEGNKFPVIAEVVQNGFDDTEVTIHVSKKGKLLGSKKISFQENKIQEIEFLLDADEAGLQNYVVYIDTLQEEFTYQNNSKHAYIDIIEGREKILILAASPHPDIKAIQNALEQNQNYEVTLHIPSIDGLNASIDPEDYNVVIFHQIPSFRQRETETLLSKLEQSKIPGFYILGDQTDLPRFNRSNPLIEIISARNEKDRVFPASAPNFSLFKPSESFNEAIQYFPPVTVPFGNYNLKGNSEVMMHQKVGKVITDKPLFLMGSNQNQKYAIFLGEGIWQWRIQEYAKNGNADGFDEIISKTVQFLSAKEDKRRFKVYPVQNEFSDSEPVVFESEIYNEIFEPVYNQKIDLEITHESGKKNSYQFTTSPSNTKYSITGLEEGIYSYEARSTVSGKRVGQEGEFSIIKIELENMNLTANHNLLKKISRNSQGNFYLPQQLNDLENNLLTNEAKSIIYTDEQYLPIINLWWLLVILILMVSLEWFLRKYYGSY